MQAQMLAPAAVLVAWSLVMLLWTALGRFGSLGQLKTMMDKAPPGARGSDLEGRLPSRVMWKSHNYTHLMEQPTIFYPAVIIVALLGPGTADITLAWAYVALRIIHSLWQATVNTIPGRFTLFLLSTGCLIALALRAVMLTFSGDLAGNIGGI